MRVSEEFEDGEFEEVLEQAELSASTGWEMDFVADIKEKYGIFGSRLLISEKQLTSLHKISRL